MQTDILDIYEQLNGIINQGRKYCEVEDHHPNYQDSFFSDTDDSHDLIQISSIADHGCLLMHLSNIWEQQGLPAEMLRAINE